MTMRRARKALVYLVLFLVLGLVFFPIFWMVSTSFKLPADVLRLPPDWIPDLWTWDNYANLLKDRSGFLTFAVNSLIVCTATSLVCVVLSSLTGYGLSRMRFRGRRALLLSILSTQMFPLSLILIPLYILYRNIHLLDTLGGLVLAFTSFGLPFSIWMMKGFYDSIPRGIEEAAVIDGCGPFDVLFRVVLPLTAPGLATVALYSFLQGWNNLLFPLALTSSLDKRLIPPGFILTYVGEFEYYWADMMAASTAVTLPVVIAFIFLQRYFVAGLTRGAVKG